MYINWERQKRGYKILAFCMLMVAFMIAASSYGTFLSSGYSEILTPIAIAMAITGGLAALIFVSWIVAAVRGGTPQYEGYPVACGSCGARLKKGHRRCGACDHVWCLNCDTWNEPGLERCVNCSFTLPPF